MELLKHNLGFRGELIPGTFIIFKFTRLAIPALHDN